MIGLALLFNLLDIISGFIKPLINKQGLNSTKMRDGIVKKCAWIVAYALGLALIYTQKFIDFPFAEEILKAICLYAILTEVVSIIENIVEMNPDISPIILKKIIGYKEGENNELQDGKGM